MSSAKIIFITLLAGVIGIGAGLLGHRYLNPNAGGPGSSPLPGLATESNTLPIFTLADLDGKQRDSSEWSGKVLVLNFWATWCPPCRKEIPAFMELQRELGDKGLQFVGIAIDAADNVKAFSSELQINYPILLGGTDAIDMSKRLGNRFQGLPFSAIFDRNGRLIYAQGGELKPGTIREKTAALIQPEG